MKFDSEVNGERDDDEALLKIKEEKLKTDVDFHGGSKWNH